ncbi:MAG TPA: hypothetical protein VMV70_00145 [Gallionella sp.]|nr:hypothetical protein [Gallionella sp.]
MRDIEGIEKVVARLKPHMTEIEARFNIENERFIKLIEKPHDVLGRLLKCHLIIEHYLTRFLSEHFGIEDVQSAKLGFFNKAMLLPSQATSAAFVKPGILKLNKLRNRAGHELGPDFTFDDLGPISEVLNIARAGVTFETPIEAIESFTTVACTWLIVPPKEHQQLFVDAFSEVRVNAF